MLRSETRVLSLEVRRERARPPALFAPAAPTATPDLPERPAAHGRPARVLRLSPSPHQAAAQTAAAATPAPPPLVVGRAPAWTPAPPRPASPPAIDIDRLTREVVRAIDARIVSHRERMGRP